MAQPTTTKIIIEHDDTKSVVYKVTKNSLIEQFSMVGRLNTMCSNNKNPKNDMVDLMNSLTPTANNLFKMIKDNLYFKTNEATMEKPIGSERKRRSNATKILKLHNAIKKTGQRSYIVNPYLIVPPAANQEDILTKWHSLPDNP